MLDHIEAIKQSFLNELLPTKTCSESTQTDDYSNLLSWFSTEKSPPPMNFISVLKCKNNLQQKEKNDWVLHEPVTDISINKCLSSNNLHTNEIGNINYDNSTILDKPSVESSQNNKMTLAPNLSHNDQENSINIYNSTLIDKTINSKLNDENKVFEEKTNLVKVGKLFTKSCKVITNKDTVKCLSKLNCQSDFMATNNCDINDLHKTHVQLKLNDNNSVKKSILSVSLYKQISMILRPNSCYSCFSFLKFMMNFKQKLICLII